MKNKIIRPSEVEWPADWSPLENGMSQSLWSDWSKCKRLLLLKVNGYKSYDNKEKFNVFLCKICNSFAPENKRRYKPLSIKKK